MNERRRVVASLASAAVLVVVAAGINRMMARPPEGGWFMYVPDAEPIFSSASPSNPRLLREGAVWLAAIAVWFALSWRFLRDRD